MRVDSVRKMNELLGKEFETNNFGKCFVIDYKSSKEVFVMFYDPVCVVRCHLGTLNKGQIKNPLVPTFYGKGLIGIGKYGKSDSRVFSLWRSMLGRTCCLSIQKRQPTYKNTSVCDEWLNFQNFAEWCYGQKLLKAKDDKGSYYQLDKDLLLKGNKIYSPETCCFVPPLLNNLIRPKSISNGDYPIGVRPNRKTDRFEAKVVLFDKSKYLGLFDTTEDAFQAYKKAKEVHIKEVAEKWKDRIDSKVYQALLNWEINIDD